MKNKITIFGAKGKIGIELVKYLSANHIPADAVTRDTSKTITLQDINWVRGDLTDYAGVPALIEGTGSLFLNTDFAPKMAAFQSNLISEGKKAGVKHIVYLSYGLMPEEMLQKSNSAVHEQHKQVEEALIRSGITYTIIRPSGFMQSWLYERAPTIIAEDKIYDATGEGKIPYIDTRDLAEVIGSALYFEPEKHANKIYELTGDEPVNFYQVADAISEATGRKITFIAESPEEARARIAKKGYPEWAIDLILYFAASQQRGLLEGTTPTLSTLLGRPSGDIYSFARDYADHFKRKAGN